MEIRNKSEDSPVRSLSIWLFNQNRLYNDVIVSVIFCHYYSVLCWWIQASVDVDIAYL